MSTVWHVLVKKRCWSPLQTKPHLQNYIQTMGRRQSPFICFVAVNLGLPDSWIGFWCWEYPPCAWCSRHSLLQNTKYISLTFMTFGLLHLIISIVACHSFGKRQLGLFILTLQTLWHSFEIFRRFPSALIPVLQFQFWKRQLKWGRTYGEAIPMRCMGMSILPKRPSHLCGKSATVFKTKWQFWRSSSLCWFCHVSRTRTHCHSLFSSCLC